MSCIFSPDGEIVLTSSLGDALKLWDTESGSLLYNFSEYDSGVNIAKFNPSGQNILIVTKQGNATIYQSNSGKQLFELDHDHNMVQAASFSPDGQQIATGCSDSTVVLWDANKGTRLKTLRWQGGYVTTVEYSRDGKRLVTGASDGSVKIWDIEKDRILYDFTDHGCRIREVAFIGGDVKIFSTADNGSVKIWDVETGRTTLDLIVGTIKRVDGEVIDPILKLSPDGKWIFVHSPYGMAKVLDTDDGHIISDISLHAIEMPPGDQHIVAVALSPSEPKVFFARGHNRGIMWNFMSNDEGSYFEDEQISAAAFSNDGSRLVCVSKNGFARVWNVITEELVSVLSLPTSNIETCSLIDDANRFLLVRNDGSYGIWDINLGDYQSTKIKASFNTNPPYVSTASTIISPDGSKVGSYVSNDNYQFWDANTGAIISNIRLQNEILHNPIFSHDGRLVAFESILGHVEIFDISKADKVSEYKSTDGALKRFLFSRNGERCAALTYNGNVAVWHPFVGSPIVSPGAYDSSFTFLAISPNGATFLTLSKDNTVVVWDSNSGNVKFRLKTSTSGIRSIEYSEDGSWIFSSANDRTFRIFDAKTGELRREIPPSSNIHPPTVIGPMLQRYVSIKGFSFSLWNMETFSPVIFEYKHYSKYGNPEVVFSPDGKRVIASMNGNMYLLDSKSGRTLAKIEGAINLDERRIIGVGKGIFVTSSIYTKRKLYQGEEYEVVNKDEDLEQDDVDNVYNEFDEFNDDVQDVGEQEISSISVENQNGEEENIEKYEYDKKMFESFLQYNFWSLEDGRLLYTFIPLGYMDFLVIDAYGRYDGTSYARKHLKIEFKCKRKYCKDHEAAKERLWVRGLVSKIMKSEKIFAPKISKFHLTRF